ncbi:MULTISPECIES: response regulator [Spirosoma]|uniref:Response regulator n=1 Tax=Spirosoma sordidisoli TaxID=2502893 RepID=A0A4Q2UHM5_9BACT|nr:MULTISPECIES: response regulator [Spirosoma]RYC68586.1 response regulator [Spirosoma sordidisoli]
MSLKGPIISIEDDPDDQFMIEHTIRKLGVANPIRFFGNGQEALDYLESTTEQPFLMLCDINMPIMNGIELRQRINQSEYLSRKAIPFVYLTTTASEESVNAAYAAMVQGFYEKAPSASAFQDQLKLIIDYWQNCLHPNRYIHFV